MNLSRNTKVKIGLIALFALFICALTVGLTLNYDVFSLDPADGTLGWVINKMASSIMGLAVNP